MAAPLFCKERRGAEEKFLIKLFSKSLQSARQRLAAYKQSAALQEKKQRPCHIGSKSCEQGRGPFNGTKKGHPSAKTWMSFFVCSKRFAVVPICFAACGPSAGFARAKLCFSCEPWGFAPHPTTFEKVDETFSRLGRFPFHTFKEAYP